MTKSNLPEEWRPVPGFPPYEVSSRGRIRREGRQLKLTEDATGYLVVDFCVNSKRTKTSVHTAVALAFIGPRPSKAHQVAHGDGTTKNNTPLNLSWKTVKGNAEDRDRHHRTARCHRHGMSKLTVGQVKEIRRRYVRQSQAHGTVALGRDYGVSPWQIWRIVNNQAWNLEKL